jgi:Flp pilus assembly protein TadG
MKGIRRRSRAQAMTEMVLILPLLVFLMLGASDLGRAFYMRIEISGASRAGMRQGVINQATDIGKSVRSEPNSAIPDTTATWGDTGPGAANDCDPLQSTHKCGDPSGCASTVFTGGRQACFAVRTCSMVSAAASCTGTWQTRPASAADGTGSNQVIDVRVVYKYVPATPLVTAFTTDGVAFYVTVDNYGLELY